MQWETFECFLNELYSFANGTNLFVQLEQYSTGLFNPNLFAVCKKAVMVWDYDPDNIKQLAQHGISAQLAQPGYHPLMELRASIPSQVSAAHYTRVGGIRSGVDCGLGIGETSIITISGQCPWLDHSQYRCIALEEQFNSTSFVLHVTRNLGPLRQSPPLYPPITPLKQPTNQPSDASGAHIGHEVAFPLYLLGTSKFRGTVMVEGDIQYARDVNICC